MHFRSNTMNFESNKPILEVIRLILDEYNNFLQIIQSILETRQ